jgi:hypothetical protein
LDKALRLARERSGLMFLLSLGALGDGRATAVARHADVAVNPDSTVLVAVDPQGHRVEIVTGATASRTCDERTCALASVAMTTSFAAGDLVGGIKNGLQLLGEHSHRPQMRHIDTL